MEKHVETEEEMKERLRKEILDELNGAKPKADEPKAAVSYGMKKSSTVSFNKDMNTNVSSSSEQNFIPSKEDLPEEETESSLFSKFILLVCGILIIIAVFFFPTIFEKAKNYKNSQKKVSIEIEEPPAKEYEKITLEHNLVKGLKYPVMHNDRTNKYTYYSKDNITIASFSNNDILYNALLDIYEGNMGKYKGKYSGKYCGANNNMKVAFDARYLKMRIENLYTRNAKYKLTNIYVPTNNTDTKYVGTWKYDAKNAKFIYYGNCNKVPTSNIEYYDIKVPIEASSSDKNIEIYVTNYVAFAVINKQNKTYTLYKDAAYTEKLTSGVLTTNNYQTELTKIVTDFTKENTINKYKYTFTIKDCAYQDYCFLRGEWIK